MNDKKFCALELAQQLKVRGIDLPCEYIYANIYRVRDEIQERYPGLSDDGYRELTVEWGGILQEDEVYKNYVEPIREYNKNSWTDPLDYKLCTMPTLDDARAWLRDNYSIHIVIEPDVVFYESRLILPNQFGVVGVGSSFIQIYNPEYHPSHMNSRKFKSYEDALQNSIREALVYIPEPAKK